jgi:hypothetical protein
MFAKRQLTPTVAVEVLHPTKVRNDEVTWTNWKAGEIEGEWRLALHCDCDHLGLLGFSVAVLSVPE